MRGVLGTGRASHSSAWFPPGPGLSQAAPAVSLAGTRAGEAADRGTAPLAGQGDCGSCTTPTAVCTGAWAAPCGGRGRQNKDAGGAGCCPRRLLEALPRHPKTPTVLEVERLCQPSLSARVLCVSDRWAGGEAVTVSERPGGCKFQALWGGAEPRGQVRPLILILGSWPRASICPTPCHWRFGPLVHPAPMCHLPLRWEGKGLEP